MFYVDNPTGVPVMPPVPPVMSLATLYFTEGGNGIPPTYPGPDWFNIVQSELINVVKEAGMLPDKAELNQLVMAIKRITGTAMAEDALMKVRNGADIPDKALFIDNLGLRETVNKANDAVPKTRKINNQSLEDDITLTAEDVSALPEDGNAASASKLKTARKINGTPFDGTKDISIPTADLTGYATQEWVLQNCVQDIDHTAPIEYQFWDGRDYQRPTDGAAMYNFKMVGGMSNVGWIQVRFTRKRINNTWYVLN
ncbi:TPA: phage tail protein [Citrobacter freundii]|nr:phage tail protein [Citrobacter freundii]